MNMHNGAGRTLPTGAIGKEGQKTLGNPGQPARTSILKVDPKIFKERYDRESFKFHHTLRDTGLFEIPRIVQLAKTMMDRGTQGNFSALNFKTAAVDSKFTALPPAERLAETVERLDQAGSWVKLTRAQDFDPDYAGLLDKVVDDIEDLTGSSLREQITWPTMTLFLASPGIATPFHIDHESNFLFQIHGEKDLCLFDAFDRELVPDMEIERFYNGNAEAATYRQELQNRGIVYRLTPGTVVHHPPLAPHWVKNGDNISVSISISFCMRELDRRARVYQANYMLRSLGLNPTPPGRSATIDAIKAGVLSRFEHKNPKSYHDVIFTPMKRIKAPLATVKGLLRK